MMNMQAGIPKAQLMAGDAMNRALTRMAHAVSYTHLDVYKRQKHA